MKISTILPVYNCENYIEQTLDVLRLQTFQKKDFEVILILDCCKDKTETIVNKYKHIHPNFNLRIIKNTTNCGPSVSRNKALKIAKGNYLHFMDADDLMNVDFYKEMYDAAEETAADVAVASFYNEKYPKSSVFFNKEIIVKSLQDKIDYTKVDMHGYAWRYLIKRSFWKKNNFSFPEDMKYVEDLVLMNKVVCFCNHICLVPNAVYYYKYRSNSMLNKNADFERRDADYKKALSELKIFLTETGVNCSANKNFTVYIRLFNILPFFSIVNLGNDKKIFLFNFIPLFKIRNKIKMQRKRL